MSKNTKRSFTLPWAHFVQKFSPLMSNNFDDFSLTLFIFFCRDFPCLKNPYHINKSFVGKVCCMTHSATGLRYAAKLLTVYWVNMIYKAWPKLNAYKAALISLQYVKSPRELNHIINLSQPTSSFTIFGLTAYLRMEYKHIMKTFPASSYFHKHLEACVQEVKNTNRNIRHSFHFLRSCIIL